MSAGTAYGAAPVWMPRPDLVTRPTSETQRADERNSASLERSGRARGLLLHLDTGTDFTEIEPQRLGTRAEWSRRAWDCAGATSSCGCAMLRPDG
jgi:hypothetical protein